jgi:tetratricopeptide (TPR) repeat protein
MDSGVHSGEPFGPQDGDRVIWPVRCGAVPPLADGFSPRQETAPSIGMALSSGAPVVLQPSRRPAEGSRRAPGSCGKTQLAVFFAESLWQARRVDLLVWISATNRASVLSGYVEAALAAIGTDLPGDAESVAARFVSWLRETNRSWLVVLDDLSDPEVMDGLWPEGPEGAVLITTMSSAATFGGRRARVLPVGTFSTREALNYMMGRLTADKDQRLGAIALVDDLGGEPVALAQAAAVIASSALTCRDYQDFFARRREQLAKASSGSPSAAAVTWTLSLEQADRLSSGGTVAQLLLALVALLDGHGIPGTIFTTSAVYQYLAGADARDAADGKRQWGQADRERAWRTLLLLERTGLLAVNPASPGPTVWMSRTVQRAVQAAIPGRMLGRVARAAADALLEAWPEDESLWLVGALRSSVTSLIEATGDLLWTDGCHPLLRRAGRSLVSARLTGPAAAYWREVAAISDRVLGPDHPDTVMAAEQLADAHMMAGQASEAVPWFEWILARRIRGLGQDHASVLAARHNLGHALVAANQLRDAISVLERAAKDDERVYGADHLETLGVREDLAAAHSAAMQFGEAIPLYRRTLADRERIEGPRHPDTSTTRQKLADTYLAAGRYREARAQYKRVLADRERLLGPDHLDTIAARGSLGSAYYASGRMATALQLYEQTLAGYERVLGVEHRDTLAYHANLATTYYKVGRLSDGIESLRDTLARCERVLPPGDPLTRTTRESLRNIAGE